MICGELNHTKAHAHNCLTRSALSLRLMWSDGVSSLASFAHHDKLYHSSNAFVFFIQFHTFWDAALQVAMTASSRAATQYKNSSVIVLPSGDFFVFGCRDTPTFKNCVVVRLIRIKPRALAARAATERDHCAPARFMLWRHILICSAARMQHNSHSSGTHPVWTIANQYTCRHIYLVLVTVFTLGLSLQEENRGLMSMPYAHAHTDTGKWEALYHPPSALHPQNKHVPVKQGVCMHGWDI